MKNIKEVEALLDWIDNKTYLNYEKGNNYKTENYFLDLTLRGTEDYCIEFNGKVIMTSDGGEWDDVNDIAIPLEITAEKLYQKYLKTIQSFK